MKTHGWIIEKNGKYLYDGGYKYTNHISRAFNFTSRFWARDCKQVGAEVDGISGEHVLKVKLNEKGKPAEVIGKGD